jgi:hypothetical protein
VCGNCRKGRNAAREQYAELAATHGRQCSICKQPENGRRLCVDHCHASGDARELLCNDCNLLLGHAHDDQLVLRRGAQYLRTERDIPSLPTIVMMPALAVSNDATRRYEQIVTWRNEGMVFKEIGRRIGVSKQRAVQLWQQAITARPSRCWCGSPILPTGQSGAPALYCQPGHGPHPSGLLMWTQFERMSTDQGGLCMICAKHEEPLQVDHCHRTERVRGLLCGDCNRMLAAGQDEPQILEQAAGYLRNHSQK